MSPQQQQPEKEETSSEQNGSSSSNNRISTSSADANADALGVISDVERCEPAAVAGHDYTESGGSSLILSNGDTKPLDADDSLHVETTTAEEDEQLAASTVAPERLSQQQGGETIMISNTPLATAAHVEPTDSDEEVTDAQLFIQYQQQSLSTSSESLVQLEETLKQPLLADDDDLGTEEGVVKGHVAASIDKADGQPMMKDGNENDNNIDAPKIDNEEHEKATTEPVVEEVGGADGELSIHSSQKSASPTNQTATFISADRATTSMSPSLLMNNQHHHREKDEWSPPIPTIQQQQQQQQQQQHLSPPLQHHQGNNNNIISSPSRITYASPPGRRTIKLRLLEEIPSSLSLLPNVASRNNRKKTPFKSFRKIRNLSLTGSLTFPYLNEDKSHENGTTNTTSSLHHPDSNGGNNNNNTSATTNDNDTMLLMDRGTITVSWYDGTTSAEMMEHVFGCVLRKLNQSNNGSSGSGGSSSSGGGGVVKKLEDVRLLDENVVPHEGKCNICFVGYFYVSFW